MQQKLRDVVEMNKDLGRQLSLERMEQLYAERALLKRERELLRHTEAGTIPIRERVTVEMKNNLEEMTRQKIEASQLLKKYIEKHGAIQEDTTQTTLVATST